MTEKELKNHAWLTPQMWVVFPLVLSAPLWLQSIGLYQYIGVEILIWMIYALGYNLLLGYTGLPSFGHGAFFGVGAYAFGLVQLNWMENLWLGLLAAIVTGIVAGGLVALFLARKRGIYFALLSIAFGQIFWFTSMKLHNITGGEDGLLNIPRPKLDLGFISFSLNSNTEFYLFLSLLFFIVVVLLWRLIQSPFGKAIKAIKQNENRMTYIGYNVFLIKWVVFTLSTAIAALAGGLFAMAQESAYPDVMSLHASAFVVMMTLIGGGFVSFWGPVVGALVYFLARDILGSMTETWLLWYGLMFMAVVLFKPEGICGIWQDLMKKKSSRQSGDQQVISTDTRKN
jgi:branched-chain amino acid transport system permease protein